MMQTNTPEPNMSHPVNKTTAKQMSGAASVAISKWIGGQTINVKWIANPGNDRIKIQVFAEAPCLFAKSPILAAVTPTRIHHFATNGLTEVKNVSYIF